jgi:tRNA 2-selenouridine synthase
VFRRHVIDRIDEIGPQLDLRVLCGPTGSAKTRVLQALARRGEQVLDLEAYADHKGSVLGGLPGTPQPSQKQFETRLATAMQSLDLGRPVFIEAESRKIGRVMVPTRLLERLRESPCIEIAATPQTRLAYLLRDYAYLGDDPQRLADLLDMLREMQSNETIGRWKAWAMAGDLAPLFEELMALHYDEHYGRSQAAHLAQWEQAIEVPAPDLSPDGVEAVAASVATLAGARPVD